MVLARHPICDCGQPTTIADHIKALNPQAPWEDPSLWSLDNGQGMCVACHNEKTQREHAL